MNKWCGMIGFTCTGEIEPGVWVESEVVERRYFGDVLVNRWKRQGTSEINEDITISNQISVVADPYAIDHVSSMTWIEFSNEKWEVTEVEVQYPRLIINLGGVYVE